MIEVRANHVVYSLSGDPEMYIISKDEAYSIIRKRGTVSTAGKGTKYTGGNPLVFGPTGNNIYGRRIVQRKDRPGIFRVHIKYQPQKNARVQNIKINLGKHVRVFVWVFCVVLF